MFGYLVSWRDRPWVNRCSADIWRCPNNIQTSRYLNIYMFGYLMMLFVSRSEVGEREWMDARRIFDGQICWKLFSQLWLQRGWTNTFCNSNISYIYVCYIPGRLWQRRRVRKGEWRGQGQVCKVWAGERRGQDLIFEYIDTFI